jgi:LPXTG-site transpeptidase (sortase) family protein
MTAILGRFGYRAVSGLTLALAVLAGGALARGTHADAATDPHLRHTRHLEHVAHIRYMRKGRRAQPWLLEIPSIGVSAQLMTLGDPIGPTLPVPPLAKAAVDAGWYRFTSVPGMTGNAVIVGHVDTYVGPAVFYSLYLLRTGDPIYVDLGAARERFTVRLVRELPKTQFPVNQVFGGTGKHQLWLITCGGDFDYQTRHYLDNIVVSATWQPSVKHRRPHAVKHTSAHSTSRHNTRNKIPAKHSAKHKQTHRHLQ